MFAQTRNQDAFKVIPQFTEDVVAQLAKGYDWIRIADQSIPNAQPSASAFAQILNKDVFSILRSFQRKSYWPQSDPKESIYWKTRFSQDVAPLLSKGYRMATICMYDGVQYPCANCYHYGIDGCHHEGMEDDIDQGFETVVEVRFVSYEEFHVYSINKMWNQEQYLGMRRTLYGRYAADKWVGAPNALTLQIRKSKLYRSLQRQRSPINHQAIMEESISDISLLFA